jgi:hypothetical protein
VPNPAKPITNVHNDGKDIPTIGFGFNMQAPGAREVWGKVIGDKVSFDEAIAGRARVTENQAEDLFRYKINQNQKELKKIYPDWDKFKPNEKIMIEDLYYNNPQKFVGDKTNFYKHATAYVKTSDPKHWDKALWEVKHNSNKERYTNPKLAKGIQIRRDGEHEAGVSDKVPLRSLPGEAPVPVKPKILRAKLNDTIIPRQSARADNNDYMPSNRYYIWRAVEDYKTRPAHSANSGKIFDSNNPPPKTGNPGHERNCRCMADYHIPNWVKIEETLENKHIVRKYITDFSKLPNFVIKSGKRGLKYENDFIL